MPSMYDRELVVEDLRHIVWSLDQIEKRFAAISSSSYFIKNDTGLEKLDIICMQLIAIGETLKHIDKLSAGSLLTSYPEIDWKKAMGIRDIITHHYFDIDSETIYTVCAEHLPAMKISIAQIIKDLQ